MGKRELLIVATFVGLGILAFRLASPSSNGSGRGFSIESLTESWQRHQTPSLASVATEGRLPLLPRHTVIRLSGLSNVDIQGETRADIAWRLVVDASDADEPSARAVAEATVLLHDDLGEIVGLSLRSPAHARHTTTLTLHVPAGLAVRIEGARRTTVGGVAAVRLDNVVGDTHLRTIAGLVDGAHHNGQLIIEDAGQVALTLVASEALLRNIREGGTVSARNGEARIEQPGGRMDIDLHSQQLIVSEQAAALRVSGSLASIHVDRPRGSVDVEARQTRVALTLDRAVGATIFTTDAQVDLALHPELAIQLDLAAGTIDASSLGMTPVATGDGSQLIHTIGQEARIVVRAPHSSIVIAPGKW